jgi:hypothetical protein
MAIGLVPVVQFWDVKLMLVIGETTSEATLDRPPPGAGFETVTEAVSALVMSVARIAAVTSVLLTNVVVRGLPFQLTTELAVKPVPVKVSV